MLGAIPAHPDAYTVNEDTSLVVPVATGVLVNDGDDNSGTLTAAIVAQPAHGTVTLHADGSFTYMPTANYSGADSFTYKAADATGRLERRQGDAYRDGRERSARRRWPTPTRPRKTPR